MRYSVYEGGCSGSLEIVVPNSAISTQSLSPATTVQVGVTSVPLD